MAQYTFGDLSDHDFECLVRDLLQAEHRIRLTTFSPGRDRGVDIRHLAPDRSLALVVQCKRWEPSAISTLLSHLRNEERPKVQRLAPQRYILATTTRMNPDRKQNIYEMFCDWMTTPDDVLGPDDLNNLLTKYPHIEQAHYKLWMASTAVFQRLLYTGMHVRSEEIVNHVRKRVRLWVPNTASKAARSILRKRHICIVTGQPGVGKSMLADMLMYRYAHHGWQAVIVSEDISEADTVWKSEQPQIFYYDDFLGTVRLSEEGLRKNEAQRLISFIRRVRQAKNKRLILTTRDYILADARLRYEHLNDEPLELYQYMLSMPSYDRLTKARILYNHLYYSGLPREVTAALLPQRSYHAIIDHRNYTPRLADLITRTEESRSVRANTFVSFVMERLDDPSRIWRHSFEQQLSAASQIILLCLATLPDSVPTDALRRCFDAYSATQPLPLGSYRSALKSLAGTFTVTSVDDKGAHIRVADPSVLDFLLQWLESNPSVMERILQTTPFFAHCLSIWRLSQTPRNQWASARVAPSWRWALGVEAHERPFPTPKVDQQLLLEALERTLSSPDLDGKSASVTFRCMQLMQDVTVDDSRRILDILHRKTDAIVSEWDDPRMDTSAVRFAIAVASRYPRELAALTRFGTDAQALLTERLRLRESEYGYELVFDLADKWPGIMPESEIDEIRDRCATYLEKQIDYYTGTIDDRDELDRVVESLRSCADSAGLDSDNLLEVLEAMASDLPAVRSYGDRDDDDRWDDYGSTNSFSSFAQEQGEIDGLFDTLR